MVDFHHCHLNIMVIINYITVMNGNKVDIYDGVFLFSL